MEQETRKKLEENGFEVSRTMERFMNNEGIYIKFMKKLLEDQNYKKFNMEIEDRDYSKAFSYAHTLKGVLSNLGLEEALNALIPVVEALRREHSVEVEYGKAPEQGELDISKDEEAFLKAVDIFNEKFDKACMTIKTLF